MLFAKTYGQIRYFHPSDEAYNMNWNNFVAIGVDYILKNEDKPITEKLSELFNPFTVEMKIYENEQPKYFKAKLYPENNENYRLTHWQHLGIGLEENSSYASLRVNRDSINSKLFPEKLNDIELVEVNLNDHIILQYPITLYTNNNHTFPKIDDLFYQDFFNSIKSHKYNINNKEDRVAIVIIAWNVLEHFFPYFEENEVDWNLMLRKSLIKALNDQNGNEFTETLEQLTAPLNDGHAFVYSKYSSLYQPQLTTEIFEDKVMVTKVLDSTLNIKIGDFITKVNQTAIDQHIRNVSKRISAGTKSGLKATLNITILAGIENSKVTIETNGKQENVLMRSLKFRDFKRTTILDFNFKKIDSNIYYLNPCELTWNDTKDKITVLSKAKVVILDLRGYPSGNKKLLNHLITHDDTTKVWMKIPQFTYPKQVKSPTYEDIRWNLKQIQPHIKAKLFVLIDGEAISFAESFIGYLSHYTDAIFIGQPTAGINGNSNFLELPLDFSITFTGMKAYKHDGSQHFRIGFNPHIYVKQSIDGYNSGNDEYYNKAIELAKLFLEK
jgi:C-terminal processing protease CtpA/Prc